MCCRRSWGYPGNSCHTQIAHMSSARDPSPELSEDVVRQVQQCTKAGQTSHGIQMRLIWQNENATQSLEEANNERDYNNENLASAKAQLEQLKQEIAYLESKQKKCERKVAKARNAQRQAQETLSEAKTRSGDGWPMDCTRVLLGLLFADLSTCHKAVAHCFRVCKLWKAGIRAKTEPYGDCKACVQAECRSQAKKRKAECWPREDECWPHKPHCTTCQICCRCGAGYLGSPRRHVHTGTTEDCKKKKQKQDNERHADEHSLLLLLHGC